MSAPNFTVEQFLYEEARLMDEMLFDEWLALWADDALYWVPEDPNETEPGRKISIINDDRNLLRKRIDRLKSGTVLAVHDLRGAMRRVVSNIVAREDADGTVAVESNFILVTARTADQQIWAGRSYHTLVRDGDSFKIAKKKVLLVNSQREKPLLQFLI